MPAELLRCPMLPCPSCHCHIRRDERSCPHCGADQHSTADHPPAGIGVLACLITAMGAACSPTNPSSGEDGKTVTTASSAETGESTATLTTTTTTTTTTDPSTTTEETSTETGTQMVTFVPSLDIAALYGVCDSFTQDCPQGEKCVPYASTGGGLDANKCVPISGDVPAGSACDYGGFVEATDNCDADSYCWMIEQDNSGLVGTCLSFCDGSYDEPMCPDGQSCLIAFDGSMALCVDDCDPFMQDCAPNLGCHFNESKGGFGCWLGTDLEGQSCDIFPDTCAAGLHCLIGEFVPMCAGDSCCTAYCDLANPSCAAPATTCTPLFEPGQAPLGAENLGVCTI